MRPERTFWEKATAIHIFCRGGRLRGDDRCSRHWHDLVALDRSGHASAALADRSLAERVGRHKNVFFREKDNTGAYIDYAAAVAARTTTPNLVADVSQSQLGRQAGADFFTTE